jgi:AhpD family alkylhydroperoxidase
MPNDVFSEKERALISLAASVGAGCRPCTAYHVKSTRAAGACERSIYLAVETALTGRAGATSAMGEWAERCPGSRPEVDPEFRASKRLITELMSIATAVAVNSGPDVEVHLAAAQDSGGTVEQIRAAIRIARQIQQTVADKIEAITNRQSVCRRTQRMR